MFVFLRQKRCSQGLIFMLCLDLLKAFKFILQLYFSLLVCRFQMHALVLIHFEDLVKNLFVVILCSHELLDGGSLAHGTLSDL